MTRKGRRRKKSRRASSSDFPVASSASRQGVQEAAKPLATSTLEGPAPGAEVIPFPRQTASQAAEAEALVSAQVLGREGQGHVPPGASASEEVLPATSFPSQASRTNSLSVPPPASAPPAASTVPPLAPSLSWPPAGLQVAPLSGAEAEWKESFFAEEEASAELDEAPRGKMPWAMRLSLGMLAMGLVSAAVFLFHQKVMMPQPARVGAATMPRELPHLQADPASGRRGEAGSAEEEHFEATLKGAAAAQPSTEEKGALPPQGVEGATAAATGTAADHSAASGTAASGTAAPGATPSAEYPQLLARAQELEQNHRRREAEEAYRDALAADPRGAEALESLAFLLLERNRNQEAAELAERAVSLVPSSSKAWVTLGSARQAMGKSAAAQEAYRRCIAEAQGEYLRHCKAMLRGGKRPTSTL